MRSSDWPEDVPRTWETFLDTPASRTLQDSGVVVVPVPYDSTTSFQPGARHGPRATITASKQLEEWDIELERDVSTVGIYTTQEIEPHSGGPEAMIERVRRVASHFIAQDKLVALLGGEHTITVGGVTAALERHPDLTVLYLDAHADLRNEYMGSRWSHACVARRLHERAPIVQVGIRSMSETEGRFISTKGVPVFTWPPSVGIDELAADVIERLGTKVYVSVDLDVLDPSIMSAVGTPEPGGMTWSEATKLLHLVSESRRIVGFDVVELSPNEGPVACAFTAAKLLYKLIGYATSKL
ncbi:MAG: agmatinase [Dehalococcoidia bacterium]|nr:agmatinase [Dehalococcoidia bacterium]